MRWRPWLWLCLSLICFLGAVYFWRLGDQWAQKKTVPSSQSTNQSKPPEPATPKPLGQAHSAPIRLLSEAGHLNSWPGATASKTNKADRFKYRLSNTSKSVGELSRSDHAILLENALFDTTRPTSLPIPQQLRAEGDPGSYIVQAHGPVDASFRALLKSAGASIVSYIPNNAYLVRASAAVAQQLEASPQTAAVLPYEPYYKVKALDWAVEQRPLPEHAVLNLVLFADAREATLDGLENLGA